MWNKTDKGLSLQDTADILKDVQKVFTDIWPEINLDPATPQGMIIAKITDMLAQAQTTAAELANILFQGGTGKWLDIRNQSLFGITRRQATPNSIDIKIVGVAYSTIPEGLVVGNAGGQYKFTLPAARTIPTSGEILLTFYNYDTNMQNAAVSKGDINTIFEKYVKTIESVINTSYIFKAQPAETDGDFYVRAEASKYYRGASITGAGLAYVRQISGVNRAEVFENYESFAKVYKNISMPPHSITYVVEGGDIEEVAAGILFKKNPGCAFGGDTSIEILDKVSQQRYNVTFFRPKYTNIFVVATVKQQLSDNTNYAQQLLNPINEYLNNMAVGQDLYVTQLLSKLNNVNFLLRDLLIYNNQALTGDGRAITASFIECFNVSLENIQVVLL